MKGEASLAGGVGAGVNLKIALGADELPVAIPEKGLELADDEVVSFFPSSDAAGCEVPNLIGDPASPFQVFKTGPVFVPPGSS